MNKNLIKVILTGSLIILIFALIGSGIYYLFNKPVSNNSSPLEALVDLFPELPFISDKSSSNNQPPTSTLTESHDDQNNIEEINNYDLKIKGLTIVTAPDNTHRVFAVESETGNLYEISTANISTKRLTNTTIRNIEEVSFAYTSKDLYVYYKTIENSGLNYLYGIFPLVTTTATSTDQVQSLALRPLSNVKNLTVTPNGTRIFFFEELNNKLEGYISSPDTSNKKLLTVSPYKSWDITWVNPTTLVLTTKPTSQLTSFSYILDINSTILTKILDKKRGLSVIGSYPSDLVLFTENRYGSIQSYIKNITTNSSPEILISSNIIPQTCLAREGDSPEITCLVMADNKSLFKNYPDDYFKGKVKDNKAIALVNTQDGSHRILLGTDRDLNINNIEDSTEQMIFFTDTNNQLKSVFFD